MLADEAEEKHKLRVELTRIVGTANWNGLLKLVLDIDVSESLLAKSVDIGVGLVKLAILAKQATVRLATSGLEIGPLTLGVARGAGIGAKGTLNAVGLSSTTDSSLLNTGPLVVSDPLDWDGTVLLREVGAINLAVWEGSIDSGWGIGLWWFGFLWLFGSGGWFSRGRGWLSLLILLLFNWGWGSEGFNVVGGWCPWNSVLVDRDG